MAWRAKEINTMKEREFKKGIFNVDQSFHAEFMECPWVIVRNLVYQLSEGDIMTIFEQYGTIISFELLRDEKTGHSKGTAIFSYKDPRSAVLAVDNLNGITIMGRPISVDHVNYAPTSKSNQEDPRKIIPARLKQGSGAVEPFFDEGSASSTESD